MERGHFLIFPASCVVNQNRLQIGVRESETFPFVVAKTPSRRQRRKGKIVGVEDNRVDQHDVTRPCCREKSDSFWGKMRHDQTENQILCCHDLFFPRSTTGRLEGGGNLYNCCMNDASYNTARGVKLASISWTWKRNGGATLARINPRNN